MSLLDVAIVIPSQRRDGYETVGTRVFQPDEETRGGNAGDARFERCPHAVGKVRGNETVGGLALGRHGAPLRLRDGTRDFGEALRLLRGEAAYAQAKSTEEGTRG